jgi:hypothetical protein
MDENENEFCISGFSADLPLENTIQHLVFV